MNRFVGVGRLTKDVELRYTASGVAVASFTIAINRTFASQSGEKEADFINVVAFRKTGENTANFCKKGSLVGVDGRIQTRSYEGQNGRVYITEVVADSVQFLDTKKDTGGAPVSRTEQSEQPSGVMHGGFEVSDSDLPF